GHVGGNLQLAEVGDWVDPPLQLADGDARQAEAGDVDAVRLEIHLVVVGDGDAGDLHGDAQPPQVCHAAHLDLAVPEGHAHILQPRGGAVLEVTFHVRGGQPPDQLPLADALQGAHPQVDLQVLEGEAHFRNREAVARAQVVAYHINAAELPGGE